MAAVAHGWKPDRFKGPSQAVAQEFNQADKGTGILARHAMGGMVGMAPPQQIPQMPQQQMRPPMQQMPIRAPMQQPAAAPLQQRLQMLRQPMMRRAAGGMVKPPTGMVKPPVLGHVQSPLGQAIQNRGNAGRYGGGMGLAPARPPRIPIPGMLRNIDQGLSQKKIQLRALGGSLNQPAPAQTQQPAQQSIDPHVHEVIMTALKHMKALDFSSAAAVLRSSPEAMSHPEIAQVENALRNSTGITPATKTLNQISQDVPGSSAPQMQTLLPPLQSPQQMPPGGPSQGQPQPPASGGMPPGPPQGQPGPSPR